MLGNAVYPVLSVVDARSSAGLPPARLWCELGLLRLNDALSADLTPVEARRGGWVWVGGGLAVRRGNGRAGGRAGGHP